MTGEDGFRDFVEVRYVELLRIAYLLTGSPDDAEDLLQAALVRLMRRWHRVDDPLPYLRRIMINQHVSWWRRHRGRELLTALTPDRRTADSTERVADREALFAALRSLPARTRAVIVLRYWADLSEADIAATLGCSTGTVKSRAHHGLQRLRTVLDVDTTVRS